MPPHATLTIGQSLPPDYFSPGSYSFKGVEIGSPWAIAYWRDWQYWFEREGLGKPWELKEVGIRSKNA